MRRNKALGDACGFPNAIGWLSRCVFRRVSMSVANCTFHVFFTLHKPIRKFPVIDRRDGIYAIGLPCRFA